MTTLYKTDFYKWTIRQAELLRQEEYAELDRDNLIEEIEDMGRSERRELENHLVVLIRHLLKLRGLPDSNPVRGWRITVKEQRKQIERLLRQNPSLRPLIQGMSEDVYPDALDLATDDLALYYTGDVALPADCPWTKDELLDASYLP